MARMTTESYEKYLKRNLDILCPHFSVRVYKRCPVETNPVFTKGEDLRIQVRWKKDTVLYEFFVDRSFWYLSNKTREDKKYMRSIADQKIEMFRNALIKKKGSSNGAVIQKDV
jgi:hypothetical protein